MEGNLHFGNAGMSTEWNSDNGGAPTDNLGTSADGDWLSSNIVSQTANSTIIDAEYQLVGQDPTIPVSLFLECSSGNDASCDYYDTAAIGLTLPDGVTFTSASGVFLSPSVVSTPEPGSFLLFGTALLGLGWSVRRSRSLRSSDRMAGRLTP
ncbi:MAG: PEP-CTERM sorting domain-containing protein [Steroidobacteraceae bacterium]